MVKVKEITLSRACPISRVHPSVEVQMTLRIELPGPKHSSVGVHAEPSLLPEHVSDALFFRGVSDGVNAGVVDAGVRVATTDVEVEVLELMISEPLDGFTAEELQELGKCLRGLAREMTANLLAAMT